MHVFFHTSQYDYRSTSGLIVDADRRSDVSSAPRELKMSVQLNYFVISILKIYMLTARNI